MHRPAAVIRLTDEEANTRKEKIDDFVTVYNQKATPFESKKAVCLSFSRPASKYSDLSKLDTSGCLSDKKYGVVA